ncbi:MAG: trimethylamine methyltransferase family protein, partial [Desulfobacterales bacterium]|nr:trimethylamine methyltransferase family protein [Desulfobacterales bacterium]
MGLMAGGHMIEQVFGVLDAIMTISYEKFIIDEEMMGRAIRICEGVDTSDAAMSIDVMKQVGPGGSYLGHPDTFSRFKDQWLPSMSCWTSYDKWESTDKEPVMVRANRKWKEILASRPEMMISTELDRDLKAYMDKVKGE